MLSLHSEGCFSLHYEGIIFIANVYLSRFLLFVVTLSLHPSPFLSVIIDLSLFYSSSLLPPSTPKKKCFPLQSLLDPLPPPPHHPPPPPPHHPLLPPLLLLLLFLVRFHHLMKIVMENYRLSMHYHYHL